MSHYNPEMGNSEEVTTEDGKYKYWREALPLPFYRGELFRTVYDCVCGKPFKTEAAYELHWRKAYLEEKHQAEAESNK